MISPCLYSLLLRSFLGREIKYIMGAVKCSTKLLATYIMIYCFSRSGANQMCVLKTQCFAGDFKL
jgi:hypothetical protein